jgi:2,3-bisphosphoglycerate-dependent phosphoglycerate mutase
VIVLVRHGETDYNREPVRVQGRLDVPLNDSGRAQAHVIADQLATETGAEPFNALYCSELSRARETAQIIGAALGLQPHEDARFAESDRGDWEGRTWAEIRREDTDTYLAWRAAGPDFRFPEGESLAEQQQRVVAALEDLRLNGLPALVACHGGTIRVALCHTRGMGLEAFHDWDVPNGAVVRL